MRAHISILIIFLFTACSHASVERKISSFDISSRYVLIHAGSFDMGSNENEYGRMNMETRHHVTITHDFEMQATPVTQIQYRRVLEMNPSSYRHPSDCPNEYDEKSISCDNYPVEGMDWYNIQSFIQAMNSKHDGYIYRLPTAAEWEYAARAGTQSTYFFGDDVDDLGKYSWYFENSRQATHPVATKLPNPWGLYDMTGNVRQWVADFPPEYTADAQVDPVGSVNGDRHEIRGCAWGNFATECRSASRFDDSNLNGSSSNGFRLVRTKAP